MKFSSYPFDYFDLAVQLRFMDSSRLVPDHPGVMLRLSSLSDQVHGIEQAAERAAPADQKFNLVEAAAVHVLLSPGG